MEKCAKARNTEGPDKERITMELEFDVKITGNILYDYMLRHTYYSASGLIGTIVGALMVVYFFSGGGTIFLIAGLVILAYLPWTLFLKSRQQMANTPAFKEPLHYKLTDEGIEVSQGEQVQMQKWEDMYREIGRASWRERVSINV